MGFLDLSYRLITRSFQSVLLCRRYAYNLLWPQAILEANLCEISILIWLHGSGESANSIPHVARNFIRNLERYSSRGLIVVFPKTTPFSLWCNTKDGLYPIEDVVVNELIPDVLSLIPPSVSTILWQIDGYSMGGYGAARIAFKYPTLFKRLSLSAAGPLGPDIFSTPRADEMLRAKIFSEVFGDDPDYFILQNPLNLAYRNNSAIRESGLKIRSIVGSTDETYAENVQFAARLKALRLGIDLITIPGCGHSLKDILSSIGAHYYHFFKM